jgi:transcriptional regulator with PAS, ATPase and Fis domain
VLQDGEVERLGDHRTRRVNARLLAATNRDLQQLVREGRFRSDLYYRLNAYQIRIPPLRERREDVRPLAKRFLEKYQALHGKKLAGFTDKAKKALLTYNWPGNIRELRHTIERGVILASHNGRIEINHLFTTPALPADRSRPDPAPHEGGHGCNGSAILSILIADAIRLSSDSAGS